MHRPNLLLGADDVSGDVIAHSLCHVDYLKLYE